METTKGKLYIINARTNERIVEIQFVPELAINRTMNISRVAVVGRNTPFYHYSSGATEVSFDLDFHSYDDDKKDVIAKCRALEALCYNDNYRRPPEDIILVFGDLFKRQVWTILDFKYRLVRFDAESNMMPVQAYASIKLGLNPSSNITVNSVLNGYR